MMNQMFQPGTKIKDYQVQSILGFGTSGAVYQAINTENNQIVAMKVQNFMFRSEAELYERLKSYKFCAVLNIYDCFKLDSKIFASPSVVIMELGNTANLHQYRQQQKRFDQDQINEIFFQISFGLWELVKLNLIHRDIKPENIVVHIEGNEKFFKICDLGLSKAQDQATTINIGTPFYMAPELFQASTKSLNFSVDIWALGAIIFELYSNMPLFFGTNIPQVQARILGTSEFMIEQEVKKYVNNQKHSEILCKIFKKDPLARPNIEYILQQLDSNRFDQFKQYYLHNQTQQNEIMQTIQKVQSESLENNNQQFNQCQILEQDQTQQNVDNNYQQHQQQKQIQQQNDLQNEEKKRKEELLLKQQSEENEREREKQYQYQQQQQWQQQQQQEQQQQQQYQQQQQKQQELIKQQLEQKQKEKEQQQLQLDHQLKLKQEQEQALLQQKKQIEQSQSNLNPSQIKNKVALRGSLKDQTLISQVLENLNISLQHGKEFLLKQLNERIIGQMKCDELIEIIQQTNID